MRASNYGDKQLKIIASKMLFRKSLPKIMAKIRFQYVYVVWVIISLDLIAQCQCSQSATTPTSDKINHYNVQEQSRKLTDDVESITSYSNLISDTNPVIIGDHITKEFQYYNEPIEITTSKYEATPSQLSSSSINVPNNHQPIHQMDQPFFPQLEPVPYIPTVPNIPNIPSETYIAAPPIPSSQNHLVKVTREPFWAPEVYKLENQYIATFRSIKSSVMGFYYRMQNFVSYIMNLFTLGKFKC